MIFTCLSLFGYNSYQLFLNIVIFSLDLTWKEWRRFRREISRILKWQWLSLYPKLFVWLLSFVFLWLGVFFIHKSSGLQDEKKTWHGNWMQQTLVLSWYIFFNIYRCISLLTLSKTCTCTREHGFVICPSFLPIMVVCMFKRTHW